MLPSEALHPIFTLDLSNEKSLHTPVATLNTETNCVSYYGVIMGNLGLLLPVHIPSRIVDLNIRLCRLPTAPDWLLGIANLSGDLIPLFDVTKLLELSIEVPLERYVIIGEGEQAVGIGIIGYPQRIHLNPNDKLQYNPPLPAILQPYVQTIYRKERLWITCDFTAFFTAQGQRLTQDWFIDRT